ncbi:hypothetical protein G3M48_000355, partial [Beauveria asiatica]
MKITLTAVLFVLPALAADNACKCFLSPEESSPEKTEACCTVAGGKFKDNECSELDIWTF